MFVSFSAYPMLETSEAPADRWQTWEPKWVVQLSTCHLPTRVWHMWGPPFVEGMIPMAANFCHFSRITEMKMNFGCVPKMYGQLVSFEFEGIFGSSLCFAFRARLCKKYIYCNILYFFLDSAGGGFSNMPKILNHRNMHQFLWWSIHVSPGSHPLVVLVPLKSGKSIEGKALYG